MTDQQNANINVRLALDQAALAQSRQGVTDFQKSLETAGDTSTTALSTVSTSLKSIASDSKEATASVNDLNNSLKAVSSSAGGIDLSGLSSLRGAGRALNQLGIPGGRQVQQLGDIGLLSKDFESLNAAIGAAVPLLEGVTVGVGGFELALSPLLLVLAPIALAVGAVALTMKLLSDNATAAAKAEEDAYNEEKRLILQKEQDRVKAKTTSTATNESDTATVVQNRADIEQALKDQQAARQKTADQYSALGSSFNPEERSRLGAVGAQQDKDIMDLLHQLDTLNKAYIDNTAVLQPMITAEEAAKKAAADRLAAEQDAQKAIVAATTDEDKLNALRETASSKSIEAQITESNFKIEMQTKEVASLKALMDAQTKDSPAYNDAKKTYDGASIALKQLTSDTQDLKDNVLPAVKAREDETQAVKDATQAAKDHAAALKKQQDAEVSAIDKYNADVTKIQDAGAQARIGIEQKYQDALIKAAQTAVDAAQNALRTLTDTEDKNNISLSRTLSADATTEANKRADQASKEQEQETTDLIDHLRKLQDIKNASQSQDEQSLLSRNFLAIAQNKAKTTDAMNQENVRYDRQEQDRQRAYNITLADDQTQAERQRAQRLVTYQQQNEDAQRQYQLALQQAQINDQRQIEQAQQARDTSLKLEAQKITDELKLREEGAIAELKLITQTEYAKQQIYQQSLNQIQTLLNQGQTAVASLANALGSSGGGTHSVRMAKGGPLAAGQSAYVNEPGTGGGESFNGTPFPNVPGLFIPSQAGNVTPGNGGGANVQININGAQDINLIRQQVVSAVQQVLG